MNTSPSLSRGAVDSGSVAKTFSEPCRFVLHIYSGDKEPIHPLSEFCRRAVALTDMVDDMEVVLVNEVDAIDALVVDAGVPCMLVFKDELTAAPVVGVALQLWFSAHVLPCHDAAYKKLCDQFTRSKDHMIKCTQAELAKLDADCQAQYS